MGKIVKIKPEDLEEYGREELVRIILHNIENEELTVWISGTQLAELQYPDAIMKYHTGSPDGKWSDAEYFKKDI